MSTEPLSFEAETVRRQFGLLRAQILIGSGYIAATNSELSDCLLGRLEEFERFLAGAPYSMEIKP